MSCVLEEYKDEKNFGDARIVLNMAIAGLSSPAFVECLSTPALVVTKNFPSVAGVQSINQRNMKVFNSYISFPMLLVTGSQSLFALFAGLLRHQVLDCSASSFFLLPFPTLFRAFLFFSFLSATRTVFV